MKAQTDLQVDLAFFLPCGGYCSPVRTAVPRIDDNDREIR